MGKLIYKISDQPAWREAEEAGSFIGSALDISDGFIHLSDAQSVKRTAALYFAGVSDLLLIAIDAEKVGDNLKWEAASNGTLFPHLYVPLPIDAVVWAEPMPVGEDGTHIFPSCFSDA